MVLSLYSRVAGHTNSAVLVVLRAVSYNEGSEVFGLDSDHRTALRRAFDHFSWTRSFEEFFEYWNAPQRFYHSADFHLNDLVGFIQEGQWSNSQRRQLLLTAFFHDIIYTPYTPGPCSDEQQSADLLGHACTSKKAENRKTIEHVQQIIRATETHESDDELARAFIDLDTTILRSDHERLMEYEDAVYKEFQAFSYDDYQAGRLSYIDEWSGGLMPEHNARFLRDYIRGRRYTRTVALYPGTFRPFHRGHYYVLNQAKQIFDKVVVLVGTNVAKDTDPETVARSVRQRLPYTDVRWFESELLPRYVDREFEQTPTIVKGLRDGDDLDEQETKAQFMRDLERDLPTTYITCPRELRHVSSSAIRELQKIGDKEALHYTRLD